MTGITSTTQSYYLRENAFVGMHPAVAHTSNPVFEKLGFDTRTALL